MKHNTLPILLKEQKILLIGGGKVALQKAQVLRDNAIPFKIIAETLHPLIGKMTDNIVTRSFKLRDIEDFFIIIDATGNSKVVKKLLKYKKSHNILVNIVDAPEFCD